MSISLVGLTLHVADVERSLNFYKRLPDSSLLRVSSGRLGCSKILNQTTAGGPATSNFQHSSQS